MQNDSKTQHDANAAALNVGMSPAMAMGTVYASMATSFARTNAEADRRMRDGALLQEAAVAAGVAQILDLNPRVFVKIVLGRDDPFDD